VADTAVQRVLGPSGVERSAPLHPVADLQVDPAGHGDLDVLALGRVDRVDLVRAEGGDHRAAVERQADDVAVVAVRAGQEAERVAQEPPLAPDQRRAGGTGDPRAPPNRRIVFSCIHHL